MHAGNVDALLGLDDASAPRFLLSGEAAKRIFLSYLE
jgi:hypothetical protein